MTHQWQYQIRIYLGDEFAEVARRNPGDPAIASITNILTKHHATMKCQFDAFADYVVEAEKLGPKIILFMSGLRRQSRIPQRSQSTSNPLRSMLTVMRSTLRR